MTVTPITSYADFQKIIAQDKPVVIDFWATWCGPCRFISPIFEQLSEKLDTVDFYKVDVDEQPDISQEAGIRAMPTFIAFSKGAKIDELVGADKNGLEGLIASATTKAAAQ